MSAIFIVANNTKKQHLTNPSTWFSNIKVEEEIVAESANVTGDKGNMHMDQADVDVTSQTAGSSSVDDLSTPRSEFNACSWRFCRTN